MISKIKYLFLLGILSQGIYAQCAMCKAVVETGNNPMAQGINNGILYLMAVPYLILIVVSAIFLRFYFKKKI